MGGRLRLALLVAALSAAVVPAAGSLFGDDEDEDDATERVPWRRGFGEAARGGELRFHPIVLDRPQSMGGPERFCHLDADGDGHTELFLIHPSGKRLAVWRGVAAEGGRSGWEQRLLALAALPERTTALDLAGPELLGRPALIALTDDSVLAVDLGGLVAAGERAWQTEGEPLRALPAPRVIARVGSPIPREYLAETPLLRDLDGDGARELVVPSRRGFKVFVPDGDGEGSVHEAWGIEVAREVAMELGPDDVDDLGRPGLSDSMEFRSVVYDLQRLDVDGDGRDDLVVRDGERVFAYRRRGGGTFSPRPDFVVDLAPYLVEENEKVEIFGKRIRMPGPDVFVRDMDGDGAVDYLVKAPAAGKIVVLRGRSDWLPPDDIQVIRISGRPLWAFVDSDLDADGRLDVWLLRAPEVSYFNVLATVLRGRFEIDVIGFDQREGLRFAQEPDRTATLSVGFSLLRLWDVVERYRKSDDFDHIPGVSRRKRGDVDGDGRRDFVLHEVGEDLRAVGSIYRDREPNHWQYGFSREFRDDLEEAFGGPRGTEVEIDLEIEELYDRAARMADTIRTDLSTGNGAVKVELGALPKRGAANDVRLVDVNGDGLDDVVFEVLESGQPWRVFLSEVVGD